MGHAKRAMLLTSRCLLACLFLCVCVCVFFLGGANVEVCTYSTLITICHYRQAWCGLESLVNRCGNFLEEFSQNLIL